MVGRVVSSLLRPLAAFIHFYVSLIPIDVGDDCWSKTTFASESGILPQCPSGKHGGIESQNDFTSEVLFGAHFEPRDQTTQEAWGVFTRAQPRKGIFFLLWWKNDGFAFLKHSCWLIHGTKEGDIQGGQHAAFCFPARVRVWQRARLEGGGTAQCSRWEKSWPKGRKDLKPKSTLWCAGPPSEKKHSPNTHMLIWVGRGCAEPRRLLKQRTDPLQWAGWKLGQGPGRGVQWRMLKAELWLLGPKNPFCRFTCDESVGRALCECWLGRRMRSRAMSFSLEPDRLGFECRLHHAWALEPWGKVTSFVWTSVSWPVKREWNCGFEWGLNLVLHMKSCLRCAWPSSLTSGELPSFHILDDWLHLRRSASCHDIRAAPTGCKS